MRLTSTLVVVATLLCACGGPVSTTPVATSSSPFAITGAIPQVDVSTDINAVDHTALGTILPLFSVPNIPTSYGPLTLAGWGTRDAAGNPTAISELAIYPSSTPARSVYVFFDSSGRIVQLRDAVTNESIDVVYESANQIQVAFCAGSGAGVAAITVALDANGHPSGQVVANAACSSQPAVASRQAADQPSPQPSPLTGSLASSLTQLLNTMTKQITDGSSVAGLGFSIAALAEFQQHQDNPTQVPIGTPISLVLIAGALLSYPQLVAAIQNSQIFGQSGAGAAGPSYTPSP